MSRLFGSICLSAIPREVMKKVKCKDGVERVYVNLAIFERKEPQTFDGRTYTHFVSVAPPKEERREGTNYIVGDLQTMKPVNAAPSAEDVAAAPPVGEYDELPF